MDNITFLKKQFRTSLIITCICAAYFAFRVIWTMQNGFHPLWLIASIPVGLFTAWHVSELFHYPKTIKKRTSQVCPQCHSAMTYVEVVYDVARPDSPYYRKKNPPESKYQTISFEIYRCSACGNQKRVFFDYVHPREVRYQ